MRTEIIGDGDPKIAVICGIHGDEPCGKIAFERFKKEDNNLNDAFKLIYANERAMEKGKWYIDRDLNRCFPGDPHSEVHEEKIAAEITEEVKGLKVLDLHSSWEDETKFGIVTTSTEEAYLTARSTGMKNIVDFSNINGTVIPDCIRIAVECGITETENAVETALWVMKNFLKAEGVLEGQAEISDPKFYRITEKVDGSGFKFVRENFSRVRRGEVYAVNGKEKKEAEEDFFPVLMSDEGYDDYIGFKSEKFSPLDQVS